MRQEDDDIYEFMSNDTIKRAEEMCASLSSTIGLERRGQTTFYQGAISDMSGASSRFTKVTVADSGKNANQFTLISDKPLPSSSNALLVYRAGPGDDMKYLGRHADTRPGQRQDDEEANKHITTYTILRDVRKR
ncbi:MAG: hypothetical protein U5L08_09185 [Xanthomonadales bacterium]|nr:hypothetical protein [Xanthomonadales bacterium]